METVNRVAPKPHKRPGLPRKIGARVQERRQTLGLTQMMLAVRAGVSLQTIGLIERTNYLSARTAERVAPILGLTVEDLRS